MSIVLAYLHPASPHFPPDSSKSSARPHYTLSVQKVDKISMFAKIGLYRSPVFLGP